MNRRTPALLIILLAISGCQKATVTDLTQEEAMLRSLSKQWSAAMEAKDVDTICALFAPNAVELQANSPAISGGDAICTWYKGWLLNPNVSGSFSAEAFEVAASGDIAVERGTYTFRTQNADTTREDVGKYLTVWTKVDGQWKVFYDMSNTNLPLPATP